MGFPVSQTNKADLETFDVPAKEALRNYCIRVMDYKPEEVVFNPAIYEVDLLLYRDGKIHQKLNTQARRGWGTSDRTFPGEKFDFYVTPYTGPMSFAHGFRRTNTVHVPVRNFVECEWDKNGVRVTKDGPDGGFIFKAGNDATDFYVTQSEDFRKSIWFPVKDILASPICKTRPYKDNPTKEDTFFDVPMSLGTYRRLS